MGGPPWSAQASIPKIFGYFLHFKQTSLSFSSSQVPLVAIWACRISLCSCRNVEHRTERDLQGHFLSFPPIPASRFLIYHGLSLARKLGKSHSGFTLYAFLWVHEESRGIYTALMDIAIKKNWSWAYEHLQWDPHSLQHLEELQLLYSYNCSLWGRDANVKLTSVWWTAAKDNRNA